MSHAEWVKLADLPDEHVGPREEDVKFKVVAPMLRLLGFTDLDFAFETPADLGRIDISVKGFRVGAIVECKGPRIRIEDCISQVEKYVRETMTRQHVAMLSMLTNGRRFQLYGVLDAIHKNELPEHLLFEFSRSQLKEADTQTRLTAILSRSAFETGAIRETIESGLRNRRDEQQRRQSEEAKAKELMAQRAALQEQMRVLDAQLGGLTRFPSPTRAEFREPGLVNSKAGFKWSREYGPQETVCTWMNDILERLAPFGSTEFIPHTRLTRELCTFLDGRGTEWAKSLSKEQRSEVAGNMIDWITAQWTKWLGGKESAIRRSDPGTRVEAADAPDWLKSFTRVWTRKPMGKYAFRRR
jgi:hypothetical protein